ncbi:MAG: DegT/DnrJ/EryC1/StrS family aminotransferase [Bacteroidota bacterium]|jgi:dTDP-4-amino-4,6-dideoxygalactose transaminase
MIPVTKSFLPPIENYFEQIKKVYANEWLTNRGKLVLELEEKLKKHLEIDNILITNNGTIPLQIALKLLGNGGEIITTPFSYVATTSSILWENCKPVFVDIHPEYLTIDESKIENAITKKTTCILATHVFGNPCNIEIIEKIAKKYKLKVIYDAAHSFGVEYKNKSIFEYGDVITCSFHATKLFHTGEGGAIFCKNKNLRKKIYYSHNFGHNGPLKFHGLGINGKISELQAAMGLSVLPYIDEILESRKNIISIYHSKLNYKNISTLKIREKTKWNYSYFPIILESEKQLLKIQNDLNTKDVFPRRYFYPSLNTIKFVNGKKMPISESISNRILCLPLYNTLSLKEQEKVIQIINNETN